MSYRFKRRESLTRGFARIAREEVEGALADLGAESGEPPSQEQIHQVRRSMKKLRALLRLMRPALGERVFQRKNLAARKIMHGLSPARDAAVQLATLDGLLAGFPASDVRKLSALRRRIARTLPKSLRKGRVAAPAKAAIIRLRALLAELAPASVPDAAVLVCESLQHTFRRARRSLAAVQTERTDATLHTLRKRVKDLQYQTLLVRRAAPVRSKRLSRQLDRLGDDLGRDHDLAVLAGTLAPDPAIDGKVLADLRGRLDEQRCKLQRSALRLARKVFAKKPGAWVEPIARGWTQWHKPS